MTEREALVARLIEAATQPGYGTRNRKAVMLEAVDWLSRPSPVEAAIDLAVRYGGTDGAHHKDWVIDQVVRLLAGDRYAAIIAAAKAGEDGPDTYPWEVGIAP